MKNNFLDTTEVHCTAFNFKAPRTTICIPVKPVVFSKETYHPFHTEIYISEKGIVKLRETGRYENGTRYEGHYTEAELPPEYEIRDIVYTTKDIVRICTVGEKEPYILENLIKRDGYWVTPSFRIAFHKDDIHPVMLERATSEEQMENISRVVNHTSFLNWAYNEGMTVKVGTYPHTQIKVRYGDKTPPNNILRYLGFIYINNKKVRCDICNYAHIDWTGTPFSMCTNLKESEMSTIIQDMLKVTPFVHIEYISSLDRYNITEGCLPTGQRFKYSNYVQYDVLVPKEAFNTGELPKLLDSYVIDNKGNYFIHVDENLVVDNTVILQGTSPRMILLGKADNGDRWIPYDGCKLRRYLTPTIYLLFKNGKTTKVYDSQEELKLREIPKDRKTRLDLKYFPENWGQYTDDELRKYNELMLKVNAKQYTIIREDYNIVTKLFEDFGTLGFLCEIYTHHYGFIESYNCNKILKSLSKVYPEVIACACKLYFLNENFSSLGKCIENFHELQDKGIRDFILKLTNIVLSQDINAFRRIALQSL